MAQLGILTTEFRDADLLSAFDGVRELGVPTVQFQFGTAIPQLPRDIALGVGLTALGEHIDARLCEAIREAANARGLTIAAVDGTFNMIDPDLSNRRAGLAALRRVIALAPSLGTSVVTLCSGTRHPASMWRRHHDNYSQEAWRDLVDSVTEAAEAAEAAGITLALEPEVNNVVHSAALARQLIDEVGSPHLKVLMDAANLFHSGELGRMRAQLDESFALLGNDIALAHAKDLDRDGDAGHLPAGRGVLDYGHYLRLLHEYGYGGAVVLHALSSLPQTEFAPSVAFVRDHAPDGFF